MVKIPVENKAFQKLDGVGPDDNRPSTDWLHQFVKKKKNITCDTWHVTRDMWLFKKCSNNVKD